MSFQDILMNRYHRFGPELGVPGEPQPDEEEKEERAEVDTHMLYKRMEK